MCQSFLRHMLKSPGLSRLQAKARVSVRKAREIQAEMRVLTDFNELRWLRNYSAELSVKERAGNAKEAGSEVDQLCVKISRDRRALQALHMSVVNLLGWTDSAERLEVQEMEAAVGELEKDLDDISAALIMQNLGQLRQAKQLRFQERRN